MALSGNKGEWSEIYVFLKLLADGRLNAADANLNSIPEVYYPIIKILRQERLFRREYRINSRIEVFDNFGNEILNLSIVEFVTRSHQLFIALRNATGRSFEFSDIENFLDSIDVKSLTALKTDKADIKVVVHDLNTGMKPTLGFSIKSLIGKDATLFNPAVGTNFIFKLTKPKGLDFNIDNFNRETFNSTNGTRLSKIALRLNELERMNFGIEFERIQSNTLQLNLTLIDSRLPEILAIMVYTKYKSGKSKMVDLIADITAKDPLKYGTSTVHRFYDYKIRNFLTESALGMTPETVWTGVYDATGGMIMVKENGDIVCYHIYNKNEFQDYLINNTKLEQASTSEDENNPGFSKTLKSKPYKFGWVYEENGELYIKLNLQIRYC